MTGKFFSKRKEDRWFSPAFENFINAEIMGASGIGT
jgi:hypothetical protein